MSVKNVVAELQEHKDYRWAWDHYLDTVKTLISDTDTRSVLEVGGGRSPSFDRQEIDRMRLDYTSNDISSRELQLAPDWVGKACFDIQTDDLSTVRPFHDRYDLVFSKMVMEHVESYERAYRNIFSVLKPGGISIAFHPVLYAFPFALNKLLPEQLSDRILRTIFPNRTDDGTPKFPAFYSGCKISDDIRQTIRSMGYSNVIHVPFYGHGYYSKFPVVRTVHQKISDMLSSLDVKPLATYAYTIAIK